MPLTTARLTAIAGISRDALNKIMAPERGGLRSPIAYTIPGATRIFSREGQGQGLATEAGRAALEWFDKTLGPQAIPAIIDIKNEPSMRLAERLGFERQPDGTYRGEPIAIFRRQPH